MIIEATKQQKMVSRFLKGEIPLPKTSNDYFFFAALDCKHKGKSRDEATSLIRPIYIKWSESEYFSKRTWKDIENKIGMAYR